MMARAKNKPMKNTRGYAMRQGADSHPKSPQARRRGAEPRDIGSSRYSMAGAMRDTRTEKPQPGRGTGGAPRCRGAAPETEPLAHDSARWHHEMNAQGVTKQGGKVGVRVQGGAHPF